ncbi:phage tail length tape measure family protein, partial [Escherichia coli]|nr:phage tail length tape measure family protein [Escherichia coli]MDL6594648.1 phage tail length tape measure family protein [Escherichia coli]MDL6745247.1 phage tail length tape measure family protein [Escherichia coli]MDL6827879.1 phage tail length tape measure family protein [Escherichia coli]MDL7075335.1 phage tail length tape measure family protein [Escherichia coli]
SVGQYKAAMRMLPAQFTDVATQLAGGQSPWLILLQQGGQVKDSFGGMIPMFRGLAGAITLPMVGATSLAVATGALAY